MCNEPIGPMNMIIGMTMLEIRKRVRPAEGETKSGKIYLRLLA